MAKKIGLVILAVVVLLLLAVAALPFWMPLVVRPILAKQDVEYREYERVGYGRFALRDVEFERPGLRVEAGRVEGFMPTAWLWRRWRGHRRAEYAEVEDWRVVIEDVEEAVEEEPVPPNDDASVYEVTEKIERLMPRIISWVPRARLGPGELVWKKRVVDVRAARWEEGQLTAEVFDRPMQQVVHLEGDLRGGLPFTLKGRMHPFPFALEVQVARIETGIAVRTEATLAGNHIVADADFSQQGHLPERAIFRSDDFRLPSDYLRLEGYRDIVGDLQLEWLAGRFTAQLNGMADPERTEDGSLPPVRVTATAEGDFESIRVETLELQSPWLAANLSAPVAMSYDGKLLSDDSTFSLEADLSQQPFIEATGIVRGEALFTPGEEKVPLVDFRLRGESIAGYDLEIDHLAVTGSLQWPSLGLTDVEIVSADGSEVVASADLDLDRRDITQGTVRATILPHLVRQWLPDEAGFSRVELTGSFSGPFDGLSHEGRIEARDTTLPRMHRFDGGLSWAGEMADLSAFRIELLSSSGRLLLTGATRLEERAFNLTLNEAFLERDARPILTAVGPSRLVTRWDEDGPVLISLDQLHWVAEDGEMKAAAEVSWPARGVFNIRMHGLGPELLTDFVHVAPGAFDLRQVQADGSWNGGPIAFSVTGDVSLEIQGEEILVEIDAAGEGGETHIRRLRASNRGQAVALAEGVLPVSFVPGGDEFVAIRYFGEVDFQVRTEPDAGFWDQFGEATGIHLVNPSLSMLLGGTPFAPVGQISGSAESLHRVAQEPGQELPVLEDFEVMFGFDADSIRLDQASLFIEGQEILVSARLPMSPREWQRVVQERELPDWRQGRGRLQIGRGEVAAFARFFPALLSPQGIVQVDVEVLPGLNFGGHLTLEGLATRPLLPIGSVQDGTARIVLEGRTAHLREISGLIGGERILITGEVDLPLERELGFNLRVQGQNVPLARKPGLVVRADVDLKVRGDPEQVPVISGQVDLRDSFYVAQLRLMPAGAVATPERRPPFFSITAEPFADWQLNVDLRGAEFLTVRGPIFRGVVSGNLNLAGTLVEPRAIGNVTIDSGQVKFPFAAMRIEQGEVTLTRQNPFQPQLFIVAASRTFGYDVRMEITGTAEAPVVEFTSTPPLTSEQALLMVTTGDLPRDDLNFTAQQRASRFAVYIGQNLLYELTGDDTAADRLIIRSGEHISEGGRETFSIEYKLSQRWSVVGEYDRFDEYNAGLKWNIFSR